MGHATDNFPQLSLVAYYGPKPPALETLIRDLQSRVDPEGRLGFKPYALEQVHATIVGLERTSRESRINRNLARLSSDPVVMDLAGFLEALTTDRVFPLNLQIGGFANRDYRFTSRGQRPYSRGFSIQGNRAVVMGWPVRPDVLSAASSVGSPYPSTLELLRRGAVRFGIVHAYHRAPTDRDNDFYFRLGVFDEPPPADDTERLEHDVRTRLAARKTTLTLTAADLSLASYHTDTLPRETTQSLAVSESGRVAAWLAAQGWPSLD